MWGTVQPPSFACEFSLWNSVNAPSAMYSVLELGKHPSNELPRSPKWSSLSTAYCSSGAVLRVNESKTVWYTCSYEEHWNRSNVLAASIVWILQRVGTLAFVRHSLCYGGVAQSTPVGMLINFACSWPQSDSQLDSRRPNISFLTWFKKIRSFFLRFKKMP